MFVQKVRCCGKQRLAHRRAERWCERTSSVTIGAPLYESEHLAVRSATMIQLLAMKLAAWRDAVDRSDARLLLLEMEGSKAEIWSNLQRLVP